MTGPLIDQYKPWRSPFPISGECPQCGASAHCKVKPATALAITHDRICAGCSTRYTPPTPRWARVIFATIGLLFLLPAGLFFAWGIAGLFGATGWDKGLLLAKAGGLFVPAVACFFMALQREPRDQRTHSAVREDQEHPLSENEEDTHSRDLANRNSGEPNQLAKPTRSSLDGQGVKQRDPSLAKPEPKDSEEPAWVTWFLWGSFLGVVFGAAVGAKIGARLVEGRVFAFFLGAIGAVIGAPIGLLIGQIVGVLFGEIMGVILGLMKLAFIVALLPFRRR